MPIDFSKPSTTDNYSTQFVPNINNAFKALGVWLDPTYAGTLTAVPTGAKRINGGSFEQYNGTSWASYTVNITGNSATATKLATARMINGVNFDGSANITIGDSTKVSKSGDTMTGPLTTSGRFFGNGGGGLGLGKITVQAGGSPPSMSAGDICFIY